MTNQAEVLASTQESLKQVKQSFALALGAEMGSEILIEYWCAVENLEDAMEAVQGKSCSGRRELIGPGELLEFLRRKASENTGNSLS